MEGLSKKVSIRSFVSLYIISYILQSFFFVNRKNVYAAQTPSSANIVAVIVDKDIYPGIQSDVQRYTTQYMQKKLNNTKALVLPINAKKISAFEISKMLENMYFEGAKNETTKLIGVVLIGDIPLPVVLDNGYMYPSIYPYVDFEKQQFVFDQTKNFFIPNKKNGQAEIWHGIINFSSGAAYHQYFEKLKLYNQDPQKFVAPKIRYDDLIGNKKYFIQDNVNYYVNNQLFAEDKGYHRFTNLMFNILKDEHNANMSDIGSTLASDLQDGGSGLQDYGQRIQAQQKDAKTKIGSGSTKVPTSLLQKTIQELTKTYDEVINQKLLAKMKENVENAARRYKQDSSGNLIDDINSNYEKIAQKDSRILGNAESNTQPLLIQLNNTLETDINTEIENKRYYMDIPIPLSYLNFQGEKKRGKCIRPTYDYFQNYYFGKNANQIQSAEELSIYKGTYQNLSTISGQAFTNNLQSVGGSYKIFSTQVEANRGNNIYNTQQELNLYNNNKISKVGNWQLNCPSYLFGRHRLGICIKRRVWSVDTTNPDKVCDSNNQAGCEDMSDFSQRNRGGASPINLDPTTHTLNNFDYRNSKLPIYDTQGSKAVSAPVIGDDTYAMISKYTNLIQNKFGGNALQATNNLTALIKYPSINGNNLPFSNRYPEGDLENPTRTYHAPLGYAQTDFFSLFSALPLRRVNTSKAYLYKYSPGKCGGAGTVYTYKTIDSRVKNTAPTWSQIANTQTYKFKEGSELESIYNDIIASLSLKKTEILDTNDEFIGDGTPQSTGVVDNLSKIKQLVQQYNSGAASIPNTPLAQIATYTPQQIHTLAQQRSGNNIGPSSKQILTTYTSISLSGMESLGSYITSFNLEDIQAILENAIQSEALKDQKVEILTSRKSNIFTNFNYIQNNMGVLKSTFSNAKAIYDSTPRIEDTTTLLQTEKNNINHLQTCGSNYCGCANKYKELCDTLASIIQATTNDRTGINESIDTIQAYSETSYSETGAAFTSMNTPIADIESGIAAQQRNTDITDTTATINTFLTTTDENKQEVTRGINITTADRPIDNIRNITFKGIGGDTVRFDYPNLYEVPVYTQEGDILKLKTPEEIRESIKAYMIQRVTDYNNKLQEQANKKDTYYQSLIGQFSFLNSLDTLANPNRTYTLLPQDFFITHLVAGIDRMNTLYGKQYVFGDMPATTTDDKLLLIAKLLRYQNSPWMEKQATTTVQDNIQADKTAFNINQKISDTMHQYLQAGVNQGIFITPTYSQSGYEVAFINSDGNDNIQSQDTPAFVKNIQNAQQQQEEKASQANKLLQNVDQSSQESEIQNECGVDANGGALLLDFSTWTSPWINALKCRRKKTADKPFSIKFSFKSALGPTIGNNMFAATNDQQQQQRKLFGQQINPEEKNQAEIDASSPIVASKLKDFENFVTIKAANESQYVNQDSGNDLQILFSRDVGPMTLSLSATGDSCPSLTSNRKTSLCQTKEERTITEDTSITLINRQKEAGTVNLLADLCVPNTQHCIHKSLKVQQLPGPVSQILIQVPTNIITAQGQIPINIQAIDDANNSITQTLEKYTISVSTGTINGQSSRTFNDFQNTNGIYQAPDSVSDNTSTTISIEGISQDGRKIVAKQNIIIAKGILTVSYNNQNIFSSLQDVSSLQKKSNEITYTLPNSEDNLVKLDNDGIAQIQENALVKLHLQLRDKNGNKLESIAHITSTQGNVTPGIIAENTLETGKGQKVFTKQSDFITTDGNIDCTLFPNLKAEDDVIRIESPGIDPINIPIHILPSAPEKVKIQLPKQNFLPGETQQGTLRVLDHWNNKVQSATTIKAGVIGPGTINGQQTQDIARTGNDIPFTIQTKASGANGYIFAYLKDTPLSNQTPAEEDFFVQKSVVPETGLNVLYLNLRGTDRGNQRGFFSDNNKMINNLTQNSDKVLSSTTELIDPAKIKQIQVIVENSGQVQNYTDQDQLLHINPDTISVEVKDVMQYNLGITDSYAWKQIESKEKIQETSSNTLRYIPQPLDSIISGNIIKNGQLLINNTIAIGKTGPSSVTQIIANGNRYLGKDAYDVVRNDTKVGELYISNEQLATDSSVTIQDTLTYASTPTFTQGSTNSAKGIGIYLQDSSFSKNGYDSIEDSKDPLLGIGFTSKFKNITYFAQGQSVGESTMPYGSAFLINFGDPLIQRVSKSIAIDKTQFDAGPGQQVFSDPSKTIFKTMVSDIDNDGLQDIIIAYTDGSIKVLKNYGGKTSPYKDLQDIMIIADSIQDIKMGDVNGDNYPDIIVQTTQNKILIYKNNQGTFDVDGTPVCLNTNQEGSGITQNPDSLDNVRQTFIEDMDHDGQMDIVTNEKNGNINIFYGGKNSYLSTQTSVCDPNRFERQKGKYQTVKRIGLQINKDRYITDDSIVHRNSMVAPDPTDTTDTETGYTTTPPATGFDMSTISNLVSKMGEYGNQDRDLAFIENPFEFSPAYETKAPEKISYLPINQLSGDAVSVYKQYEDLSGTTLQDNDTIRVTVTILALQDHTKVTYAENLAGPRNVNRDDNGEIPSLMITGTQQDTATIYRNNIQDYLFMIDDISLQNKQYIKVSYDIQYRAPKTTSIDVKDEDAGGKTKDGYPDIIIQSTDSCLKSRKILFNRRDAQYNNKTYEEYTDNVQNTMDDYLSGATAQQNKTINDNIQQTQAAAATNIDTIPGLSSMVEKRTLSDFLSMGGGNVTINTEKVDQALAGVSKKIDQTLQGLCQGFSVNLKNKGCGGLPVPFNEAFLAPGDYHIFGCVPGITSPLYGAFKALNSSIGKGIPIVAFPTSSIIPIWPPVPVGAGGIFEGSTSQFRLYIAPTLTLGVGFAICLGPYSVGTSIPKPFRDMGGNCIVFATPAGGATSCPASAPTSTPGTKQGDEYNPDIVNAGNNGVCNKPPIKGNKIVFTASDGSIASNNNGASSPLQLVNQPIATNFSVLGLNISAITNATIGNTANNSALFPQGNFGGLFQMDESINQTTNVSSNTITDTSSSQEFQILPGQKVKLKISGAQTKGLVKCLVKDWMNRQVQYIINNLTKMTVQVDLPDVTQLVTEFGKIQGLSKSYQKVEQQNVSPTTGSFFKKYFSKQAISNYSAIGGQNPFEAIAKMFDAVPLINIDTKDINLKIPLLTSDEIEKYGSYLQSRVGKNESILNERDILLEEVTKICSSTPIQEALKTYNEDTIQAKRQGIKEEISTMQKQKISQSDIQDKEDELAIVEQTIRCHNIGNQAAKLISIKEASAKAIKAVKENILVLQEYKRFPLQLSSWIHVSDRYLAEITSVLSQFTTTLTSRLQVNANRFSQYVDGITIIVGAIKTWQAIINFSVNRSEKCGTCSKDSYSSFSCSLSFLCPQLPIFKIPPFKIPDIHLDLSHVELGIDILLPKFNLVPISLPLPQLPNLPEPPDINITIAPINIPSLNIPVLPSPPQLPELPSFIPNVEIALPVLPPAPKIPKIIPEINATLKVADFIGKIFCIVKGGIGLVAENGVKGKIEQLTQRTRNVPIFDFFDLTSKFKSAPLQGFEYKVDAYTRLKYNFDDIYSILDNLAQTANNWVTQTIEKPADSIMNAVNTGISTQIQQPLNSISNPINLNIQPSGFMSSGKKDDGLAYNDAYKKLQEGLMQFKAYAKTDKTTQHDIQGILQIVNAETKVTPANKEIADAQRVTQSIVNDKAKEIQSLEKEIQNYDQFITNLRKNNVQLVSKETQAVKISSPLININSQTKLILQKQEDPTASYVDLNKQLVKGYIKSLDQDGAQKLNMTEDTYKKSKQYLTDLKTKMDAVQTVSPDTTTDTTQANQTLLTPKAPALQLADSSCPSGTCPTASSENAGYQPDLSLYAQGVFVETGTNTGKVMINVVNNNEQILQVGKNQIQTDLNNDKKKDILMRDQNTVYIKYADQESEQKSKGGNDMKNFFSAYYVYQGSFGKWWIDDMTDLQNQQSEGYLSFGDETVKVRQSFQEVKNFATEGQSFDNIQMSWKNSQQLGEAVNGYIIRYTDKITTFFEKVQYLGIFGYRAPEYKYIVVLPQNTSYQTGLLSVDDINKSPLAGLLSGRVTTIQYFDPNQDKVSISLYDMPRQWIYAEIASLQDNSQNLSSSQRKSYTRYTIASPRSNQIVAGNQLLGDNKPPKGDITLQRETTKEILSTGNVQEGFINTWYTLGANWQDDGAVTNMSIEKDGKVIAQKTGFNQTGSIALTGLFFTGESSQTYIFKANDANGNPAKQQVKLSISIPKIDIVNINQRDKDTAEIVVKIQHDIDEGMISFQRTRDGKSFPIKGTLANIQGGYNLGPNQTIITGGIFSFGSSLGLYLQNNVRIGSLDPEDGEISIRSGRENTTSIGVDFLSHIPQIIISNPQTNQKLFQISLPGEKLAHITMLQGKPDYSILQLNDASFQKFQGGYCIENQQSECITYISTDGQIYVPGVYASSLQGQYAYNAAHQTIEYTIQDGNANKIAIIEIKIQSLLP